MEHYLTVGELKKIIKNIPDDARVLYERIEDVYFQEHGWDGVVVYKKNDYIDQPDQYVQAFTAFLNDEDLCITAHF